MKDRSKLTTEQQNIRSRNIDSLTTEQIVAVINAEDKKVAPAVARERKAIAAAADMIAARLEQGGRLFYVGAGTSGRLGVLDAAECPPTFGVRRTLVQGIIAGGRRALTRSIEGAEDSAADGQTALQAKKLTASDVVVGIAACGLTPYVHGALQYANKIGAGTVFITCAPEAVRHIPASIIINPVVGPEVIAGSTRMKAGTATKLVLNTLTTAAMIKLGKVYGNLMVDLTAVNDKLRDRSIRIVMQLTGLSRQKAAKLLTCAGGKVKPAVVMHFHKVDFQIACKLLRNHNNSLRNTIREFV
ncbi:MAG TPA: N-acetylmuramic acid 6-phosphate etherase [Anaerohalosphaeraceae bacterium]|nr:N-acetylmuramic acid 6-phosphate etherase [Phycisphaerae bacterium]HOK95780.1 N-acetylmuramic acid 6-phosphate etherase [Anaerohalosphaeraceae bacterium]HOL31252.1 N-acetylmuramic acid 6-phosphate etherase [Anaerohalosphaeraceae bacterium]HOM75019.1 N-acetylmuramic acid 6-phosphate etherase [Anaerohalosphaeraceae bacterium]HPC63643.1 N-acetylmuramic acid 6-phosphate etherase [Anaerohalosphaeraceae bacterium]